MEDLVQAANARKEAEAGQSRPKLSVTFKKESESCSIVEVSDEENQSIEEGAMGAEDSDVKDSPEAVLLQSDMKKSSQMQLLFPSMFTFFSSYRSSNPDERVTPFAIVLLIALFLIYVLNQADRLVLAVTIPAGLRCELKASECGGNGSVNSSLLFREFGNNGAPATSDVMVYNIDEDNNTNTTADCIHFSDSEQGLLTGLLCMCMFVTRVSSSYQEFECL